MIGQLCAALSDHTATPRTAFLVGSVATAAFLLLATPGMALECPTPPPAGTPGVIQETPDQITELSQVLTSGDLGNRIPVFVHSLRSRHPNVPIGDLVNYLVTAYCPVVNSLTGLSNGEKQARCSGREPGYPGPPAKIPTCGFPASGSYRRSDVIAVLDADDP